MALKFHSGLLQDLTLIAFSSKWVDKKKEIFEFEKTNINPNIFEDLKNTSKEIIPLIRFSCINSKDFFDKIRPFKTIIPNNIYEEVMEFHLKDTLPKTITLLSRIGTCHIESRVLRPNLSPIILNWIELLVCYRQSPCLVLISAHSSPKVFNGGDIEKMRIVE
ncbi:hypothetical protein C1645_830637 [Glomus cerebriforme]|uniref:Uncharacterized protein n=1 Tax=Glomus cerebriforme TaxID=658196 RepID=A0A397SH37_9GLOM|nr:hypothetical protein C1645_830637 [Glomus cerebriforme]